MMRADDHDNQRFTMTTMIVIIMVDEMMTAHLFIFDKRGRIDRVRVRNGITRATTAEPEIERLSRCHQRCLQLQRLSR